MRRDLILRVDLARHKILYAQDVCSDTFEFWSGAQGGRYAEPHADEFSIRRLCLWITHCGSSTWVLFLYIPARSKGRQFSAQLINIGMALKNFLTNYPLVAIAVLFWSMGIVTGTLGGVFMIATEINAAMATIVTSAIGIPSLAFALYQARMEIKERDLEREDR
jgi:hypothetical protein